MPLLRCCSLFALVASILSPAFARAQNPWTVTVVPPTRGMPIGTCGAVRLQMIDPATKDVPRGPTGRYITIADFDMRVTSPDGKSVAGFWRDATNWEACACKAGTAGTKAIVTATYPASSLGRAAIVPGVAFSVTGGFALSESQSTSDPRACYDLTFGPKPVSSTVTSAPKPTAPATGTSIATAPVLSAPISTAPVAGTSIATAPIIRAPAPTTPATGTSIATAPVVGAASPTTIAQPIGPGAPVVEQTSTVKTGPVAATPTSYSAPPSDISFEGTPAEVLVKWRAASGTKVPIGYVVDRWKTSDPECCKATSGVRAKLDWRDPVAGSGFWTYAVSAVYADSSRAPAFARYEYVEPVKPQDYKAVQLGRDSVLLTWKKVNGASHYVIGGPPSNAAVRVDTTAMPRFVVTGVPLGPATFKLATMYVGTGAGVQVSSEFVTTNLDVVRRHYRLIAESIRVTSETVDEQLSGDGKYDEIFVASIAEVLDRRTAARRISPTQVSAVHGDVSFWPPPARVRAGSASGNGGIRAGDNVTPLWAKPSPNAANGAPSFVLWEGELRDGMDDLLLHPTLWEVDQKDSEMARITDGVTCGYYLCNWANRIRSQTGSPQTVQALIAGTKISYVETDILWLSGNRFVSHMERQDSDRPIGLEGDDAEASSWGIVGNLRDRVVVLSREKIEAALAAGTNKIEVRFWDHWAKPGVPQSTVSYLNGDYLLTIRIERLP